MIRITCPKCAKKISLDDSTAGTIASRVIEGEGQSLQGATAPALRQRLQEAGILAE